MPTPKFIRKCAQLILRHRRPLLLIAAVLLILFIAARYTLENVARKMLHQKCLLLHEQQGVRVEFDYFGIRYLSTLELQGLRIIPSPGDTLLSASRIAAKINLLPLLSKRIDVGRLEASEVKFRPTKQGDYCNYRFLLNRDSHSKRDSFEENNTTYSRRVAQLFRLLFGLLPSSFEIHSWDSSLNWEGHISRFCIDALTSKNNRLHSQITLMDSSSTQHINIAGKLHKRKRSLSIELQSSDGVSPIRIPYLEEAFEAKVLFNTLAFSINVDRMNASRCDFSTSLKTNNLSVHYWRLADTTIIPGNVELSAICHIEKNRAELAEGSSFSFNGFCINPKLSFENDQQPILKLLVDQRNIDAQRLIKALPKGLLSTFESIQLKGTFDYRLLTEINFSSPDELILEAEVTNDHITIVQPGLLNHLSSSHTHRVYDDKGIEVAAFNVGAGGGAHNLPLGAISPLLQNAVLQSEDGNFYSHKGFSEKHFREAMIENLIQHRFVRGGSTISMQLVKNLFLNRNKNIFRKVEEMALTWLIENKRVASKQRMFELYLNIIEWGPGIYGANDAAHFYFDKSAAELTLDEAVFMACIVPNPKKFHWWFDASGQLKENRLAQMRRVTWLITRHNENPTDADNHIPSVMLRGRAADYLRLAPADLPIDEESTFDVTD